MKQERIWVYPEFKKKLKLKATEKNTTILGLTKELSLVDDYESYFNDKKRKFRI